METYLLEQLPAVHGILIGVGVAFSSAYIIYAYQKLQESKDAQDDLLDQISDIVAPNFCVGSEVNEFLNDAGDLDWSGKVRPFLRYIPRIFEHKFRRGVESSEPHPVASDDDEVERLCGRLMFLLSQIFIVYPFNGRPIAQAIGVPKQNPLSLRFDKKALIEIRRRVSDLASIYQRQEMSFIEIGLRTEQIEKNRYYKMMERISIDQMKNCPPHWSDEEKERVRLQPFEGFESKFFPAYGDSIRSFFEGALHYQNNILPVLEKTVSVHQMFDDRFRLKSTALWALYLVLFVFLFGIVVPLVLVNAAKTSGVTWHPNVPIALLLISMLPYMFVWRYLLGIVMSLTHK